LPINGNVVAHSGRAPSLSSMADRSGGKARTQSAGQSATIAEPTVPHKRLWRLTDALGAEIACELDAHTSNRVLLTVTRDGEAIIKETFADKRDALARSVGIYKEMKAGLSD
jgi:hypothetical protein